MTIHAWALLAAFCGSACAAPAPPPTGTRQPQRCDQHAACPRAQTCRWKRVDGKLIGECQLEVGRCYDDWDCVPARRCQRFDVEAGVCVMTGL